MPHSDPSHDWGPHTGSFQEKLASLWLILSKSASLLLIPYSLLYLLSPFYWFLLSCGFPCSFFFSHFLLVTTVVLFSLCFPSFCLGLVQCTEQYRYLVSSCPVHAGTRQGCILFLLLLCYKRTVPLGRYRIMLGNLTTEYFIWRHRSTSGWACPAVSRTTGSRRWFLAQRQRSTARHSIQAGPVTSLVIQFSLF